MAKETKKRGLRERIMEGLAEAARGSEYAVIVETTPARMAEALSARAGAAWKMESFSAVADPAHPSGRREGDEVAMIYVAVVRRFSVREEETT